MLWSRLEVAACRREGGRLALLLRASVTNVRSSVAPRKPLRGNAGSEPHTESPAGV